MHILQLRSQNKWIKQYWVKNIGKFEQEEKTNLNVIQELLQVNGFKINTAVPTDNAVLIGDSLQDIGNLGTNQNSSLLLGNNTKSWGFYLPESFNNNVLKAATVDIMAAEGDATAFSLSNLQKTSFKSFYNYSTYTIHEESTRDVKNHMGKPNPCTLVKIPVDKVDSLVEDGLFLFKFRYNDSNAKLAPRNNIKVPYFAFKQLRYKARKLIPMVSKQYVDELGGDKVVKNNFTLNNQYSITTEVENPTRYYRMFRKNKVRSENMPVVVSKRLLRVKRTLVLPTHINITAVTNSYDVVHS